MISIWQISTDISDRSEKFRQLGMMGAMRLLLATAAMLAIAGTAAGATAGPRIALLDTSPLTVAGTGFGVSRPVHVTIGFGRTHLARNVGSTTSGRFLARFRRSVPDASCTQLTITAATARTRMTTKIVPAGEGCGAQHVTSDPAPPQRP